VGIGLLGLDEWGAGVATWLGRAIRWHQEGRSAGFIMSPLGAVLLLDHLSRSSKAFSLVWISSQRAQPNRMLRRLILRLRQRVRPSADGWNLGTSTTKKCSGAASDRYQRKGESSIIRRCRKTRSTLAFRSRPHCLRWQRRIYLRTAASASAPHFRRKPSLRKAELLCPTQEVLSNSQQRRNTATVRRRTSRRWLRGLRPTLRLRPSHPPAK
jgi:hypothetical protein